MRLILLRNVSLMISTRAIRRLAAGLATAAIACGGAPPDSAGPAENTGAGMRVLFVGNSLTYTNDLPGVVNALAEASGRTFSYTTIATGGWSLEEHWAAGLEDRIREIRADVVVLQQGPSSVPANQAHLLQWVGRVSPVIREVGGEPALLMVWPDRTRRAFFPAVRQSYAAAAHAVSGDFIPAGQTWIEAWELDGALEFWGRDGFHPSYLGTLAGAMTVYAALFDVDPATIPDLADDDVPAHVVTLLRQAVTAAIGSGSAGR